MADKDFVVKNGLIVNTNALVVDGTNNKVGVNTASPDATLSVVGTANVSGNVVLNGSTMTIASNTTFNGNVIINSNTYFNERIFVGNNQLFVPLYRPVVQAVDNFNGFVQMSSQNLSNASGNTSLAAIRINDIDGSSGSGYSNTDYIVVTSNVTGVVNATANVETDGSGSIIYIYNISPGKNLSNAGSYSVSYSIKKQNGTPSSGTGADLTPVVLYIPKGENLGTDSCSDLVVMADNTFEGFTYFLDIGMNNSNYDGTLEYLITNASADSFALGANVYQKNSSGTVTAYGILKARANTVGDNTKRDLIISIQRGYDYIEPSDATYKDLTDGTTNSIVTSISHRNYAFTIGKGNDGYLYTANGGLTIGTSDGGRRLSSFQLNGVSFASATNVITVASTDNVYQDMLITGTGIQTNTLVQTVLSNTTIRLTKTTNALVTSGSIQVYDAIYDISGNPIIFHTNGMYAENEVGRFVGNGNFVVGPNTTSRADKFTVAGTANITGNTVFGNNIVVAGNTTIGGNANVASIFVGTNASLTTSTLQIGNATANIIANSTILKLANSSSVANLSPLDLKIGSTVVNSSQITATLFSGNISGTYANFSGQVNTATIYASGSANIAGAVQANSSGIWTTGQVNAASVTVGNSSITNAFVANATTMFIGNSVANTTHNVSLIQLANSTAIANLTPIDLKLGSTVVNTTVIQVSSVMNINTTALKIGDAANSFIANSTTLLLGNSTVNAIVNSTAVVFANTIKTVVLSPQSFQGTAQDSQKLNNQAASYYTNYSDDKAANAYANAVSAANTLAGNAYTSAITWSGNAALAYGNATTFASNATNLTTGTVPSGRLTGAYGGITGLGTLGLLQISGNTLGNNFSMTSNPTTSANLISFGAANVTFDTSVLAIDSINNRVGINTTTPDASLQIVGTANVSGNLAIGGNINIGGSLTFSGAFTPGGNINPSSNNLYLGNTTNLWNFTGNNITVNKVITANVSSSATIYVGANVVANTISIKVGDGSVYSSITNTKIETTGDVGVAGVIVTGSTAINANNVTVSNVSIKIANSTVNATINSTAIAFVNASATAVINATSHPGTANNSNRLNGQLASYYTDYSDSKAGDAYTNATTYVGTTLGGYALKTGTTFTGPVIVSNTVSIANTLTISNDVTINSPGKLSARIQPRVLAYTLNSATPACNTDLYDVMIITGQTTSITSMSTNLTGTPFNSQRFYIAITLAAATFSKSITWGSAFEDPTGSLPSSITTSRKDMEFIWNAATNKWRLINYIA